MSYISVAYIFRCNEPNNPIIRVTDIVQFIIMALAKRIILSTGV